MNSSITISKSCSLHTSPSSWEVLLALEATSCGARDSSGCTGTDRLSEETVSGVDTVDEDRMRSEEGRCGISNEGWNLTLVVLVVFLSPISSSLQWKNEWRVKRLPTEADTVALAAITVLGILITARPPAVSCFSRRFVGAGVSMQNCAIFPVVVSTSANISLDAFGFAIISWSSSGARGANMKLVT